MTRNIVDLRNRPGKGVRPRPVPPNPERKERRASPLRARRRRARIIAALIVLLLCAGLAYGVHALSYLAQFNVNRVIVTGTDRVPQSTVRAYVDAQLYDGSYHFLSRTNIFLYPRAVIEKGIVATFPRVKSAVVSRDSLVAQAITVTIAERAPFAEWCMPARASTTLQMIDTPHCYAMDDTGFIFAEATSTDAARFSTPYIFSGSISDSPIGKTFVPTHLPGILALIHILEQGGIFTPTGVRMETDQDFSVTFAQGFYLKASFGEDADVLARNLRLVLSSDALLAKTAELEYIDLRFGNRVYYKLKGAVQVQQ